MKFMLFLALTSCVSRVQVQRAVQECADQQVGLYSDLCAEGIDERWDAYDAHFEGVKCASEAIKECVEGEL